MKSSSSLRSWFVMLIPLQPLLHFLLDILSYEEVVSKASYIHSDMILIYSSGHSKATNFQHKIHCIWKMSILIEIWNPRYQQIQVLQWKELLFGSVIKYIYTDIKKNKEMKSCLIPKPPPHTSTGHLFPFLITFYPFWNTSMKVAHKRNIFHEIWIFLICFNCKRKSIM